MSTQIGSLRTKLALEASAILASLRTQYEQAQKEEDLLHEALQKHETKVLRFNELAAEYSLLQQAKASIERTYHTIIRRIEEIDINRIGGQGDNLFVISRASLPTQKSWPHKGRNMVIAFILGGLLAVGLCFFFDYMDVTVKGETDVRHLLQSKVLGGIPDIGTDAAGSSRRDLIVQDDPKSHAAEAFRALRTALAFTHLPDGGLRSIVVSSTLPEEGKSLASINLAIAQANAGKKTLIIDTDMRKPRLHESFSMTPNRGLSDLLADGQDLTLQDVVVPTNIDNLHFLPCGPVPSNPVEMLDSSRFATIMDEVRAEFDLAVLDSPPGLTLVDSLILGKHADGLLLVIRSFLTPKGAAQHFAGRIREARVPLLGVLLNNVDLPKGGRYYGSYYYGRYSYYYYAGTGEGELGQDARGQRGPFAALRKKLSGLARRFSS